MRAIELGDLEELRAKHPEAVSQIDPMPSAADTEPSLLVNPPSGYAAGATVVNFNMPEDREALC